MRKAGVADEALCLAVAEMAQGLIDADLGGHLVKSVLHCPDKEELKVLQQIGKELLALNDRQLKIDLSAGEIVELCNGST
jgi:hypothetical protein